MADQYLNETGISVIRDWVKSKFALETDLQTLEAEVQEIIAEGGEPNVIETVKVNNVALTPDAQKAVDISVPTRTSDLTNDGDGTTPFATTAVATTTTNGLMSYADKTKLDGISAGAEENIIETVKVNGTALTPDGNKAVDVEIPIVTADASGVEIVGAGSSNGSFVASLNSSTLDIHFEFNDSSGDGSDTTVPSITTMQNYVAQNGGKIDKIKIYGIEQTITNKEIDLQVLQGNVFIDSGYYAGFSGAPITSARHQEFSFSSQDGSLDKPITLGGVFFDTNTTDSYVAKEWSIPTVPYLQNNYALISSVPTVVSDLTNDSGYQTASEVQTAINSAVSSAYKYKGSVASASSLPASGNVTGDVYDVQDTGMNYAWNGTAWDTLGQLVDTSLLWSKSELTAMTVAEIQAILNA